MPNGKKIQIVTSEPIPEELSRKRANLWEIIGELLHMIRPVLAILAIRMYGEDSYVPYFLSLAIELIAFWLQRKMTVLRPVELAEWESRQKDIVWRCLFKKPFFKIFLEFCKTILRKFMGEHRWLFRLIVFILEIQSSITLTLWLFMTHVLFLHMNNQNSIFFRGFVRNLLSRSSIVGSCLFFWDLLLFLSACFSFLSSSSSLMSYRSALSFSSFSLCFLSCFFLFSSMALSWTSFSLRKYSPVSILISSILGCCSGGKGVYYFFLIAAFFFFLSLTCLNFGKKRSQFSFWSYGSFINYLFIISSLIW